MPGFFGRGNRQQDRKLPPGNAVQQLQKSYWTFNSVEKTALLNRYPDALSWSELLRLQHLTCLELSGQEVDGKKLLDSEAHPQAKDVNSKLAELCAQITEKLLSIDSPYRPRHCEVWQSQPVNSPRSPEHFGIFRNASITHLGCIEVIRLENEKPKEIAFIPLDDIQAIVFAGPALFRAARVIYDKEAQEDEIVLVPLLYGISWSSMIPYDHDGSMTRFFGAISTSQGYLSIGSGQQDFRMLPPQGSTNSTGGMVIFGIGSVSQIATSLEMIDSRFDAKARRRGIDPDAVRRQSS